MSTDLSHENGDEAEAGIEKQQGFTEENTKKKEIDKSESDEFHDHASDGRRPLLVNGSSGSIGFSLKEGETSEPIRMAPPSLEFENDDWHKTVDVITLANVNTEAGLSKCVLKTDILKKAIGETARDNVRERKNAKERVDDVEDETSNGKYRGYTAAEVLLHDKEEDCWIIHDGGVYDVTKWLSKHPGGKKVILSMAGRDATDLINQMHPVAALKYLKAMKVGYLQGYEPSEYVKACREFQKEVEEEGFFVTRYSWYIMKTGISYALLALTIYLFLEGKWKQNEWIQIAGAVVYGIYLQQTAFLGHDAGHNCIFRDRVMNSLYGCMVGNLMTGISMAWWKDSHNVHHSVPNAYKSDPDIQHLPVFAVTSKFFSSVWSTYHKRIMPFDKVARFLVSYQHYLFYPVMALGRFNLYIQGYILILVHNTAEWKKLELAATIGYWSWVSWMLSQCLSWKLLFVCLFLSHAIAGVLHVQICLSHFSMEIFDDATYKNDDEQFFDTQLRTCTDINCSIWMDWFHGGLQNQTAHHIFPRVPRHNLRRLREKLEVFCRRHGRVYHAGSFFEVNVQTIKGLKKAAMEARAGKFVNFKDTMLWEGMCAQG